MAIPWKERIFLTYSEAGEVLARPAIWVREQAEAGRLQAVKFTERGPAVVAVESVIALGDEVLRKPQNPEPGKQARPDNIVPFRRSDDDLVEAIIR